MNERLEQLSAKEAADPVHESVGRADGENASLSSKVRFGLCLSTAAAVFVADILMPLDVAMGVLYVLVILISLRLRNSRFTYGLAILCTLTLLAGFHLSPDSGGRLDPNMILINRLAALLAIWSSAFLGIQLTTVLAQREAALNAIKILKGRLPICAHCKKIRDSHEDWVQLEEYLLHHSEAVFSHSICPSCKEEHFGDLVDS